MTVPERLAALNALRDGPERQTAIIAAMEDSAIPVRDAAIRLAARYIEPHVLGTFVADDVNAVLRNAAIAALERQGPYAVPYDFLRMKDGAIVCNSGHFDVEINLKALKELAAKPRNVRPGVQEYKLPGGKRIRVLAEGRLVNLSAAEGHPAAVMDMSFANQALACEYLVAQRGKLPVGVHLVPAQLDQQVAKLKLNSLGFSIDKLTAEQRSYLAAYDQGT